MVEETTASAMGSSNDESTRQCLSTPLILNAILSHLPTSDLLCYRQISRQWNTEVLKILPIRQTFVTLRLHFKGCDPNIMSRLSDIVTGCKGMWDFPFSIKLAFDGKADNWLTLEPNWAPVETFLKDNESYIQKILVCDCAALRIAFQAGFSSKITPMVLCGKAKDRRIYEGLLNSPPSVSEVYIGVCSYHKCFRGGPDDPNYILAMNSVLNSSRPTLRKLIIHHSFHFQLAALPELSKVRTLEVYVGEAVSAERDRPLFVQNMAQVFPRLKQVSIKLFHQVILRNECTAEGLQSYLWKECTPTVTELNLEVGFNFQLFSHLSTLFPNVTLMRVVGVTPIERSDLGRRDFWSRIDTFKKLSELELSHSSGKKARASESNNFNLTDSTDVVNSKYLKGLQKMVLHLDDPCGRTEGSGSDTLSFFNDFCKERKAELQVVYKSC